jgi:outer membrane protein OmpA-like peptidoglycan-associated protein
MRHPLILTVILLLMPLAAQAQVTIDLRALETLQQAPAPASRLVAHPPLRAVPANPTAAASLPVPPIPPNEVTASTSPGAAVGQSAGAVAAMPATPTPPSGSAPPPTPPPATLPTAAPAVASLAPIPPPVVPATAAPPAPPPISPTAGTTAAPASSGLQVVFKPDESDLSPASNGAITDFVKATPSGDTVTFNVVAYAASVADDPSAARRTSLARGLSVRAALLAAGVPSTRIYVRALGASIGDGPADRVDMTVLGVSGATTSATASATSATAKP